MSNKNLKNLFKYLYFSLLQWPPEVPGNNWTSRVGNKSSLPQFHHCSSGLWEIMGFIWEVQGGNSIGEWGERTICLQFVLVLINTCRFLPEGWGASLILPTAGDPAPHSSSCCISALWAIFSVLQINLGCCTTFPSNLNPHQLHSQVLSSLPAAQPPSMVGRLVRDNNNNRAGSSSAHPPFSGNSAQNIVEFQDKLPRAHKGWSYLQGFPPVQELAWSHWWHCHCHRWSQGRCSVDAQMGQQHKGLSLQLLPQPHNPIRVSWMAFTASVGRRRWQAGFGCSH